MKALVIAQPTKAKRTEPSPAWHMYQGSQQKLLRAGLERVWHRHGFRQLLDLCILSPFYGPVEPVQVLDPYDFGWSGRPQAEVEAWVRRTRVVERLAERTTGFDLVLVLLSRTYLAPLHLRDWVPDTAPQRWLFVASPEGMRFLPGAPNARWIPAGAAEARREKVTSLNLKSYLLNKLCTRVAEEGPAALEQAWASARRF